MSTMPAPQAVPTPSAGDDTTSGPRTIRVGTRKSALALKQANFVAEELGRLHPHVRFEIVGMESLADRDKITALYKFDKADGKGLWTNELEAGLRADELDIVVHSLKDMPTHLPDGLVLACVPVREDPRDAVVVKAGLADAVRSLDDLPAGAVIGTSSVRRMAQLRRRRPDLRFRDMRGNIDTRLRKLDAADGEYSALILAAAGLSRMGLLARVAQYLDAGEGGMLHAVGQGGLGLEARAADADVAALLAPFECRPARLEAEAERALMRALEGGCSVPIGVETRWPDAATLHIVATVVSVDGTHHADAELAAPVASSDEAVALGQRIARLLTERGAQQILDVINAERAANQDGAEKWVPA